MNDSERESLLRYAEELERRDHALAVSLDELAALTDEVHALRLCAVEVVATLVRLPADLEAVRAEEREAEASFVAATAARREAEDHAAKLEVAKRPSQVELERVRRDLKRAHEEAHDATVRRERVRARMAALHDEQVAVQAESEGLVVAARSLAARLQTAPRVTDAGKTKPGTSVTDLDEWGARARAALFVAHSTHASERERLVFEANALGVSMFGEEVGTISVSLVRKRLEQLS